MLSFPEILAESIRGGTCAALVLSRRRKSCPAAPIKVAMRPVSAGGTTKYQFASRSGNQETHENLAPADAIDRVHELFGTTYEDCHLFTTTADYSIRVLSDGRILIRRRAPTRQAAPVEHNRSKQYLIPEDVPCAFLAEIGVMTPAGKVKASKQPKFRQINRFLEFIEDVLPSLPQEGRLDVVDFGCGKSYLTFAVHHLLTRVHKRQVQIVGFDRNAGVIHDCQRIARHLRCEGLEFRRGDISEVEMSGDVHLAISLHACDTATDAALAKAVGWQADVILAVPCCQHEVASKVQSEPLSPLLKHGILRERFAALATDALRAEALEVCGYKTQILEFIDLEHTAKNLLLRGVRRRDADPRRQEDHAAAYRGLKVALGIDEFALERALGDEFRARMVE